MKKIFLLLLTAFTILSVGGCSDFGFNPTGHWQFESDNVYSEGKLIDSATPENIPMLADIIMVFEKSGTGYIESLGDKTEIFKYSYDNEKVNITYLPNENHKDEIKVEFDISDDGSKLYRVILSNENSTDYSEIFTYKRI